MTPHPDPASLREELREKMTDAVDEAMGGHDEFDRDDHRKIATACLAALSSHLASAGRRVVPADRDFIARHFLYATGMFDTQREIAANPEHRLVVSAYKAADAILAASPDPLAPPDRSTGETDAT